MPIFELVSDEEKDGGHLQVPAESMRQVPDLVADAVDEVVNAGASLQSKL